MTRTLPSRTGGDLLLGGLQVLVGVVILGHAATATTLSLLLVGWLLFGTGVFVLGFSLIQAGQEGAGGWILGGGVTTVLGLVFLRQTEAAAVTVTLVTGALWAVTGVVRLSAARQIRDQRLSLVLSGLVSLVLGLIVLFNLVDASYQLLGILLGIQVVAEGLAVMLFGREARRGTHLADEETALPA